MKRDERTGAIIFDEVGGVDVREMVRQWIGLEELEKRMKELEDEVRRLKKMVKEERRI